MHPLNKHQIRKIVLAVSDALSEHGHTLAANRQRSIFASRLFDYAAIAVMLPPLASQPVFALYNAHEPMPIVQRREVHPIATSQALLSHPASLVQKAALPPATSTKGPGPFEVRPADPSKNNGRKEAVFVDTSVVGYQTLENGIRDGVAIVEIDGSASGLTQMAKWAETHSGFDALHILSHGAEAELRLGADTITDATLSTAAAQAELAAIGDALNAGGDLLLYGCDVAGGPRGKAFLQKLALLTGADVSASTDITGAASLGGNWVLEANTGAIDASSALDEIVIAGYDGKLAIPAGTMTFGTSTANQNIASGIHTNIGATVNGNYNNINWKEIRNGGSPTMYIDVIGTVLNNSYDSIWSSGDRFLLWSLGSDLSFRAIDSAAFGISSFVYLGGAGTLTVTGKDGSNNTVGTKTIVLAGGTAQTIDLTAPTTGSFTNVVSITISNSNSSSTNALDDIVFTAAVTNVAPTITGAVSSQTVNDNATISPFAGVTIGDADTTQTQAVSVTLDTAAKGSFTTLNGFTNAGGGVYTFSGTAAAATTAIRGLVFTPTANRVAPTLTETTTFTISTNDGVAPAVTNNTTTVISTSINDVPTNVALSNSSVNQSGGANAVVGALSSTDADVSESFTYSLVAGTGDTNNASFNISGTSLRANNATTLAAGTYSVRVQTADGHGGTFQKAFTITVVDNVAPTVSSIALVGTPAGNSTSIQYTVTFSEAVTGVDTTDFTLTTTGSANGTIASVSGSGTTYTVTVNSITGAGTLRLDLNAAGTGIADLATNAIATGFTSGAVFSVDTVAPTVTSVSVPASATYKVGQTLDFTVNFSENVTLTGSASTLGLTVGATARNATYLSKTATSITYRYTVQSGDLDTDGIAVGSAITLNGDTLTDAALNNAVLTLNSVGALGGVLVDGVAPTVSSVSVPANATYHTGQTLDFTVNFSENVTVTGTASTLGLTVGSTARNAVYLSKTANSITYRYTVLSGDSDTDGIAITGLTLNTDTITDTTGNAASLTLAGVGATGGILVDTVAPTVSSIALVGTPAGNSTSIQYTVTFSESVTGVDTADFTLTKTGSANGAIASVSGSGTTYTVTVNSITGAGTLRLDLNAAGTGIADSVTNPIATGFTSGAVFTVDTVAPTLPAANIVVNNQADPHKVVLTFSENLDASTLGAANTWIVTANGGTPAYTVASVAANNNQVTLTLVTVDMTNAGTHILNTDAGAHLKITPPSTLKDAAGNTYAAGLVTESGATLSLDNTAPTLSSVATSAPTASGGTLAATASEKAMGYWIAVAAGSAAPSVVQVNAGVNYGAVTVVAHGSGALPNGTAGSLNLTGLAAGTSYDIHLAANDAAGNSTAAISSTTLTTSATNISYTAASPTGNGTITASFSGGGASCSYMVSRFIPVSGGAGSPPAGTAPAGVNFPQGLFDFTTSGCIAGATLNFTITYPQALPAGTVYWKYGPTANNTSPHWYQIPAVVAGNTATFSITDGGLGDDDLAANGTIVDQGGPGFGGSAAGIPTLSQWALAMLAGIVGLFGMRAQKRKDMRS